MKNLHDLTKAQLIELLEAEQKRLAHAQNSLREKNEGIQSLRTEVNNLKDEIGRERINSRRHQNEVSRLDIELAHARGYIEAVRQIYDIPGRDKIDLRTSEDTPGAFA